MKPSLLLPLAPLLLAIAPVAAQRPVPGSDGLGDPFYPQAGNGGYDVQHYSLTLEYQPALNHLSGTTVISAIAGGNLARFHLDLRGFAISRLLVDGRPAPFEREGQELEITPPKPLVARASFTVTVDYSGTPTVIMDPSGLASGWIPTPDGAIVLCEPQGSPCWYPVNDSPRDKATYDFRVTVPQGLVAMANGVLVSRKSAGGKTTWVWSEKNPMAPYLATVTLGLFELEESALPDGTPVYIAVDPRFRSRVVLSRLPEMVELFSSLFGPYPFDSVGAIVDDASFVGYALETQTKPVFDRMPVETILAHEIAHQWFGNSVTLDQWPDIWLHEGFATWCQWIWSENTGGKTAQETFDLFYTYLVDAFWDAPPGAPGGPEKLFSVPVYRRGGMTLQALRAKVGDPVFFRILRDWAAEHRHANATTTHFIALAERGSGVDLRHFFDVWLYQPKKPVDW